VLELPFETTRAALSLLYSGALDRSPNIKFQLAHLGGAVPFLAHRMASLVERDPELGQQVPEGPLAYIRRFFLDTALSLNSPALAATLDLAEPDRIVFGTDWPYLPDEQVDMQAVNRHLSDSEIASIAYKNAASLVPRFAT
jgi:predicted TIM-barrel fold metal-dependent hydrolase